jgi:hypothetical protein
VSKYIKDKFQHESDYGFYNGKQESIQLSEWNDYKFIGYKNLIQFWITDNSLRVIFK